MRKLFVFWMVCVVSLVFSTTAMAVDFGIKGGVNWAKIKLEYFDIEEGFEDEVFTTENIRAFQVGAFFTFDVAKNLSIQPEIYYAKKGSKISQSETYQWFFYEVESEFKLSCISTV